MAPFKQTQVTKKKKERKKHPHTSRLLSPPRRRPSLWDECELVVCVWRRRRRIQLSHQGNYRGVIELRPRVPQKMEKLLLHPGFLTCRLHPSRSSTLLFFFFFFLPPHTTTPSQVEALIRTSGNPPGKSPRGGGTTQGEGQETRGGRQKEDKKKQGMRNRSDKCARCRRAGNLYSSSPPG